MNPPPNTKDSLNSKTQIEFKFVRKSCRFGAVLSRSSIWCNMGKADYALADLSQGRQHHFFSILKFKLILCSQTLPTYF